MASNDAAFRPHRHRLRACGAARGGASREAEEIRAGDREGPPRRGRLRAHRHYTLEDLARDGAQSFRLARARLLRRAPTATRKTSPPRICAAALAITLNHEVEVLEHQFARNKVSCVVRRSTLHRCAYGRDHRRARRCASCAAANAFIIAVGTAPYRPAHIPFDGETVVDADEILELKRLPRSLGGDRRQRHRHRVCDDLLSARCQGHGDRARSELAAASSTVNWSTSSSTICAIAACRCASRAR